MRAPTTTARGPKPRAQRRPPGRLDSHNPWTKPRGPVTPTPHLADTEHGTHLPVPEAFARADQAVICRITLDDLGVPLDLGRTHRIASPGQTLALAVRDRGCTFPGCDRPPGWTQRHHINPWWNLGETNLDNLTLLCGHHHRTFEQLGWQCLMINRQPHWKPPTWIDPTQTPIRNTHHDHLTGR